MKSLRSAIAVLCLSSLGLAEITPIGTVSVRGDVRVDDLGVKGNATLFDGSVLETGSATADLRVQGGPFLTMSANSKGTLHRDHFVLQQGASEITSSLSFPVEAAGLRVVAARSQSKAVVSLMRGNTVQVAVVNGAFSVAGGRGMPIGTVTPGHPMTYSTVPGDDPSHFTATGKLSEASGHFYLSVDGTLYELSGTGFSHLVGKEVSIDGTINAAKSPSGGAVAVVDVRSKKKAAGGLSPATKTVIAGVLVAAGVGLGVGIYEVNAPVPTASTP